MKENISALKKQINEEIENGNFETADRLSRELCKLQSLNDSCAMPDDFFTQIKSKNGKVIMINLKKYAAHAAIIAGILAVSGMMLYTSISHFGRVEVVDKGTTATSQAVSSSDGVEYTSETNMLYTIYDDEIKSLELHNGWSVITTDYEGACKTGKMNSVFSKKYEQNRNARCTAIIDYDNTEIAKIIESEFKYGGGTFCLIQTINYKIETGSSDVNKREYKGYTLIDNPEAGDTMVSVNRNNDYVVLTFEKMSEDEIHSVLDTLIF